MITERPNLISLLESGALVLTANKRLSRYLETQFELQMVGSGRKAWLRPPIYPYHLWCLNQYALVNNAKPVVSQIQGDLLWEQILERSIRNTGHELLQIAPTASMAWKAEQLLLQYRTAFKDEDGSEDQKVFLKWRSEWHKQLTGYDMVDSAEVPYLLASAIKSGQVKLPAQIVFAGFDDFDPSILLLQEAMTVAGSRVVTAEAENNDQTAVSRQGCTDRQDEVRQCALWVKHLVGLNPECRIGVVAPRLDLYRDLVEQMFRSELAPGTVMMASDEPPPFNLSVSHRLADEGVIVAAFKLLSVGRLVSVDELGWLLRTPYLNKAETASLARAACEREVRSRRQLHFPVYSLSGLLSTSGCDAHFIKIVEKLISSQRSKEKSTPGTWAERIANLLSVSGWPGERTLSSREFQAVERFRRLLGELASLDCMAVSLNRQEAISRLLRMAAETDFQPKGVDSGIQIVGMLEAAGMQFDYLWILGMHAGSLPAKSQPNPFIPLSVQRQLQMPHADAGRELAYADNLKKRLFAAAPSVIVSWPQQEEGMPFTMNRYLVDLPDAEILLAKTSDPTRLLHDSAPALETVYDNSAPPVVSRKKISGGTRILKDQALCPFRAFAHHRLRAEAFDEADIGIDVMTRGSLVHKVLELFWQETGSQKEFLALTQEEVLLRLDRASDKTVESNRWKLPQQQKQIERERLVGQAMKWLAVERKRPDFVVLEHEKEHTEVIGRLKFKTVIDRIDQLENGQLAIIDYKTGQADPAQWFDERITEPQLPIYCQHISPDDINAVLFAIVRPGKRECKFSGVARNSESWSGVSQKTQQELLDGREWESFDQILDNWRLVLPKISDDFMDGVAQVDPVDLKKACRYCDLVPLCRIHERANWQSEEKQ